MRHTKRQPWCKQKMPTTDARCSDLQTTQCLASGNLDMNVLCNYHCQHSEHQTIRPSEHQSIRASALLTLSAHLPAPYLHYLKWHKTLPCCFLGNFWHACKLHSRPLLLINHGPVLHSFCCFPVIRHSHGKTLDRLRTMPWRYSRGTGDRLQRILMSEIGGNCYTMVKYNPRHLTQSAWPLHRHVSPLASTSHFHIFKLDMQLG